MKLPFLPAAAVVILGLATISIVRSQPKQQTNPPPVAPPTSDFPRRVAAIGLVEASSENISLGSHVPGIVDKVLVTAGQDVRAGDPLVKLDTRALEAALGERKAALAVRRASVDTAKAGLKRAAAALVEAERNVRFAETLQDNRGISAEELARRRSAVEIASAARESADAEIAAAEAQVGAAQAAVLSAETDLVRSTVRAPIDGRVLQLRIRPGEFAGAGGGTWLVLGRVTPLHLRVDIDEHEAWRVQPMARAVAQVRGNANLATPVTFVRFEPYVVPKQSLTGASNERVDTRVLQAIYRIERADLPLFVGQQMDVFIDASGLQTAMVQK